MLGGNPCAASIINSGSLEVDLDAVTLELYVNTYERRAITIVCEHSTGCLPYGTHDVLLSWRWLPPSSPRTEGSVFIHRCRDAKPERKEN